MKKLFLSTLLLALPLLAIAYDCQVDSIYYNLIPKGNVAEVTFGDTKYSGSVIIPEKFTYEGVEYSVTSIGEGAFNGCSVLTSVTIGNSVTSIGVSAFYGCRGLTSVTIPNSVTSIGDSAFYGCRGLTSVTIPNSVTYIGYEAFHSCIGLTSVNISNSVTSIGDSAFYGCIGLTSVTIPNSVTSIGESAFHYCTGLTSVTIPNSVISIGGLAFFGCRGLTSVTIPNSVTFIGDAAFRACRGLTSVTIPNSVTSIGRLAFSDCTGLTSVTIPNSVTSIGYSAFSGCSGLTSVSIPNTVSLIGIEAFEGCVGLTSLTIGKGIKTISSKAFANSSELTDVYCFADKVPSTNKNAFDGSYIEYATLHVPAKSLETYKSTAPWSNFGTIVAIEVPEHTLTYNVDGTTYKTYTIEEGEKISAEAEPAKEGYTFSGWSDIPSTMPDHDVTVTGSFTINKYKLTYMVDGTNYKLYNVEYNSAITPETAPIKEGYTFSGWSEIPETMPANDVTITGTFMVNKYKLTYMVDGEEYKASDVDYGTAITAEAVPSKEGYTFSGWSEIPSTMPDNDVTVTGTFTINKYTITYIIDGEVFKSMEVEYNSAITPPDAPAQEGYDFAWADVPETMPANDITIYGAYTTGINALTNKEDERQVFTPDGKRLVIPKKGLNIIRMSDGTVKKVVVK